MQSEIQKNQINQLNFINGGVRHNLQGGSWRQMKFKGPAQYAQYFLNTEEFQYAILKRSIYTFAPSPSKPSQGVLISYNFVNQQLKQWQPDKQTNVPELRKRHAIINYDGRICIFGGLSGNKFYNDFHSFCYYSNMWRPVLKENNTVLPPPRVPFVFTEISNGNLLLFGGANETGFLSDAYLLVDFTWKQLKIKNRQSIQNNFGFVQYVTRTQGIRYCRGQDGIYFFGGLNGLIFNNQFFFMSINQQDLTATISKVKTDSGPRPCPRAYHNMQMLGQSCIAVYGGIGGNVNLKDLSVFNINKQSWSQITPLNGPLPFLSQAKMYFQMNAVYLLGVLIEKSGHRKTLVQCRFPQFQIIKSEICANCIKRLQIKQKQQMSGPKKPFVSNGLIYNMAVQINFPYHAISLLIDCAQKLNATQLSIRSQQTNNRLSYLELRFNGNYLSREQYSSIISHSYMQDPVVLQIIDKIKLGSMRLGKTLVYISVVGQFRRVFLFSADSLIISHYHQLYAYFAYEQRIVDQWLATQQSIMHKKFIINLLKSYFVNPSILINSITNHCFLVFQSNVIMTNQKIYYGQLIASTNDITQCKNNKKVEFLDNIGFSLNEEPEVSLAKYLQYLYLSPSLKKITIQSKTVLIKANRYLQQLQKLEQSGKLKSIIKQKITVKQIQAQCFIYDVVEQKAYNKQLKGIYLYYRGRLINRMDVTFGDLFWQKFYKTKYRKPFGLWTHVGVINILKGAQPKTARNQFKNQSYFNYFIRYIKKQIISKNTSQVNIASKSQSVVEIEEQGNKPNKMIKRQKP